MEMWPSTTARAHTPLTTQETSPNSVLAGIIQSNPSRLVRQKAAASRRFPSISNATINYTLAEKLSNGPEVKIDPIKVNYGDGTVVKLTLNPVYRHSIQGTPQVGQSNGPKYFKKIVFASTDLPQGLEGLSDMPPMGSVLLADGSSGGGGNYSETYKGKFTMNLLGYDATALFRLGYLNTGEDYWLAYANLSGINFTIFPEVNLMALGGGVGHNFSADQIMLGGDVAVPSNTGTSFFTADMTISSSDHFIYEAKGIFTLETSGVGSLAVGYAKLFGLDGFTGGLKWGSGSFDGALTGGISMLDGYVSLTGNAGLHFGGDGFHVFVGTRDNPVKGQVLFVKNYGYMMLGNDKVCKGLFVGTRVNEKIGGEFGGWGAYVEYNAGLEASITPSPLQITVDAMESLDVTIVDPIKDISGGASVQVHGCIGACGVEVWIMPSLSACPIGKAWIQMQIIPYPKYMDANFESCL